MDMQLVTKDLDNKISEGKAWCESGEGLTFDGPLIRKFPTTIQLSTFLDSPNRVERFGLSFVVTIESPRAKRSIQVNVRIKPTLTDGPKADSHPYVVSYVVNQTTGLEDEIEHEHFIDPKRYIGLSNLGVSDWYMNWLFRALKTESGKLFSAEASIK